MTINCFLRQIGIVKYDLHRPYVLQGLFNVSILSNIKLLIIVRYLSILDEPLIYKCLNVLNLKKNQIMIITSIYLDQIPEKNNFAIWLLDVNTNKSFNGVVLSSCSFHKLINDGNEKKNLWHQICKYDNYFFK
ncbi:MAG: DNA polymerase III subunit psi [Pantoea sp. Brub]|nr:DNA polymerase III subunit psi [Pantoea sp. Brub]